MKAYWGSGGKVPRILDLDTRWRWVVSFTPRPFYPQRKCLHVQDGEVTWVVMPMQCCTTPSSQRSMQPPSSTTLHGITTQKISTWAITTVKTSYLTSSRNVIVYLLFCKVNWITKDSKINKYKLSRICYSRISTRISFLPYFVSRNFIFLLVELSQTNCLQITCSILACQTKTFFKFPVSAKNALWLWDMSSVI
jgi:hypothetical protein